jgi:tetratricopeptide (TPR) repeat protein
MRMLEECLVLRRKLGQPVETAATLSTLSLVRLHAGDAARAREGEMEAVAIFRELRDRMGEAIGQLHLGEISAYVADDAAARDCFERCLAIAKEVDSREIEAECERKLGELNLEAGELPAARSRFARSLEICRATEDKRNEASALWWTAKVDFAAGNRASARATLNEAIRAFQTFEMKAEILGCLEDYARLQQHEGIPTGAVQLYAASAAYHDRLRLSRSPHHQLRWRNAVEAARAALGDDVFETAWQGGQSWTLEQAVEYAMAPSVAAVVTA